MRSTRADRVVIPRVPEPWDHIPQGTYARVVTDGRVTAALACPGCGVRSFMLNHTIAEDGTVEASVGCPKACGYHEWVRLGGWAA